MKVLVIGSGGREHAIAYALSKSPKISALYAIPGNPGIAKIAKCYSGSVTDLDFILNFVKENEIDFTVVGPEVPLCLGLVDLLEDNGYKAFGPRKKAAMLEGSKVYSKEFMKKHHIPTARSVEVSDYDEAIKALELFSYPVVIKADGLAAGKGVVIAENFEVARDTLEEFMIHGGLDNAGRNIVMEEFLKGFECSLLCFVDGETIVPMVSAKDHKQIFDGNKGPNTGGMGTVSPNPFMPNDIDDIIDREILKPFLKGLKEDDIDYRGVLFIGLMIDSNDVKVLEFNVRFGDPETQVILLRLQTDLFEIMQNVADKTLKNIDVKWSDEHVACLVLASGGYPGSYEKGKVITGLDKVSSDSVVFHAGTKLVNDEVVTSGGRVLNICASAKTLHEALDIVYENANVVDFEGKYYRKDIGLIK